MVELGFSGHLTRTLYGFTVMCLLTGFCLFFCVPAETRKKCLVFLCGFVVFVELRSVLVYVVCRSFDLLVDRRTSTLIYTVTEAARNTF